MEVEYSEIEYDQLQLIKDLWEKLNNIHSEKSIYFVEEYSKKTFDKRREELFEKSENGILKIFIAKYREKIIGYCICSIVDNIGEIDSIFLDEGYRNNNIGDKLLKKATGFFESKKVKKQVISVYSGNENVIGFYNKHNFYEKYIILEKR